MLKCGITGYNLISAYIESGYFMEFNKENLRKIRGLILFTLVVLIALWKYTVVLEALGFLLGIMFPFLLGAAIAFILNVPMHFLEEKLFYNKNYYRAGCRLSRDICRGPETGRHFHVTREKYSGFRAEGPVLGGRNV